MKFNKIISICVITFSVSVAPAFSIKRQAEPSDQNEPEVKRLRHEWAPSMQDLETFFWAIRFNMGEVVENFLREHGKCVDVKISTEGHLFYGFTALQYATELGHENIVQILLKAGASVNARIESYGHPYHGFTALLLAASRGNASMENILLSRGANVDIPVYNLEGNFHGFTPLIFAAFYNNLDSVRFILKFKPNVEYVLDNPTHPYHGLDAVQIAIRKNFDEVVKLLLPRVSN